MIQLENKFRVLFVLLISVGLAVLPQAVRAAMLYAGSAYQTVEEGQTFVVDWFLNTEGKAINTLSLRLNFSNESLEILEASPGQSLFSLWLRSPVYSNEDGEISLVSGAPAGLSGEKIPVFRTVFRAKKQGTGLVTMKEDSTVLLADGRGTADKLVFPVLNFLIGPKGFLPIIITSPTHPEPDSWYQENRVVLKFEPRAREEYSYSFSSNLEVFPDELPDQVLPELIYESLPDGIYYFKLNSRIGPANWQEAGIFRAQIDATPPEEFQPLLASAPSVFGGQPFLSFSTVDKTSGMLHYKVRKGIVSGLSEVRSPYLLPRPLLGNTIEIQAVDRAGNIREAFVYYPGLISWLWLGGIGILSFGIILFLLQKRKSMKN